MKVQRFLLLATLLIGAFFRLYRIREYITFLGDEGRDVLIVKRIIVDHKLTLLGPITSIGSMYMGPIYYYFMVPFLWLSKFDPVGPAMMVVIFSLLTIYLIYKISSEFLGSKFTGFVASLLYAISPLPIIYGRSSWNPNIVPFFSALLLFSMLKVIIRRDFKWILVSGLSLGILLQLHYVTLMFFPILLSIWLSFRPKIPFKYYLFGVLCFILSYSPFLLFELRHEFVNTNSLLRFVLKLKSEAPLTPVSLWRVVSDITIRLFWRLPVVYSAEYAKLFLTAGVISLYFISKRKINEIVYKSLRLILIYLIVGILSYGLYRGVIYDYYLGSLFIAPYLLTGFLISYLWSFSSKSKAIGLILFVLLIIFNLNKSPLKIPPNNLVENTKTIARFIFDNARNEPYNFALIAGKNSDHAYRYFLELWGNPPVGIENPDNDPQRRTVTNQLLIVCEEKVCQPLGHPLWEIAGFGMAEIENEWTVSTARVFRLVHKI